MREGTDGYKLTILFRTMRFEAEIEKVHTFCQKMCRQKMFHEMWSGLHRALPASAHIKAWFSETGDFFWQYHKLQIINSWIRFVFSKEIRNIRNTQRHTCSLTTRECGNTQRAINETNKGTQKLSSVSDVSDEFKNYLPLHIYQMSSSLASVVSLHPGECYSIAGVTTSQVYIHDMLFNRNYEDSEGYLEVFIYISIYSSGWLSSYLAVAASQVQDLAIWARWESPSTRVVIESFTTLFRWESFRIWVEIIQHLAQNVIVYHSDFHACQVLPFQFLDSPEYEAGQGRAPLEAPGPRWSW